MPNWFHIDSHTIDRLERYPTALPETGFLWLDYHLTEELSWVPDFQRLTGLQVDELHIEDLNNMYHPSHFDAGNGYSLLIIRSLSSQPLFDDTNKLHLRTRPAFFLVSDRVLVTFRSADSRTFQAAADFVMARSKSSPEPKSIKSLPGAGLFKFKKPPTSPDELQIQIVGGLVDRYLEIRQEISSQLDRWQRDLLSDRKRFRDWSALLSARNELTRLETVAEDQTDALNDWVDFRGRKTRGDQSVTVKASDTLEHLERVSNLARRLGESTEAAVQLHFSATAHKTNEIITVLTILSAVFMPLTLMTGLFGMNFEKMPLLANPSGFWLAITGSSALSAALVYLIWHMRQRPMPKAPRTSVKVSSKRSAD